MNRAVNASPSEQGRISSIDYGVNVLLCYVAYNDGDSPVGERFNGLRAIHSLNLVSGIIMIQEAGRPSGLAGLLPWHPVVVDPL